MSVYPRADGIYVYDFRIKRVRFYGPTGCRSKREALEAQRTAKDAARQKLKIIQDQRTGPLTVNAAFDRFWLEVGQFYKGSYHELVFNGLAWMLAELGANTLIRDIGPNRVTELVARRRARGPDGSRVSNATVNRSVTELLRRILRRAGNKWEQTAQKIDWTEHLLPEPKERVRELRDQEEAQLVQSMRPDYWPAIAFKLESGFRRNEVVGLSWPHIDFAARAIAVTGKGGKASTIPLTTAMAAILSPLRGHHPVKVFTFRAPRTAVNPTSRKRYIKGQRYPITEAGLKTAWRRHGGRAAGLEDFRLHDARHTTATRLLRESGNLKMVQKLLRHEDIATTGKYAHVFDADLREAMESVVKSRKKSRTRAAKAG